MWHDDVFFDNNRIKNECMRVGGWVGGGGGELNHNLVFDDIEAAKTAAEFQTFPDIIQLSAYSYCASH